MTFKKENKSLTVIMILDKLPPLPIGGAETQALRLAKKLTKKNVEVIFLTPGRDHIKGQGEIEGMTVFRLHSFFNYFWDLSSTLKKKASTGQTVKIEYDDTREVTNEVTTPIALSVKLRYIIFFFNCLWFLWGKRQAFDIIHVHSMEWPSFVGGWLCKIFKKPLIIKDATMNGINGLKRYPRGKIKLELLIRRAHFVAMTRAIRENYIRAGVPPAKITDIPNGIEVTEECKQTYASTITKVIFVGNLSQQPAKGIDILLKAWKNLTVLRPDARLNIVGDGPISIYQDYLIKSSIHESVSMLGKRTDVKALLLESDIFVLPSRREGMPNALMEAMLLGLPCIATDISGCQDLIKHGESGLLVPPANVEKLADAITYLMNNPNEGKKMGTLARKTILELNTMEIVANQYLALYNNVANTENKP